MSTSNPSNSNPSSNEDRQFWRAVMQAIRPFPLTTSSVKLLVGVSGGADSLALLHLLWQKLGSARLAVAHLNHQLRPEAGAEAEFVVETAASWDIPCEVSKVDVSAVAKKFQLSIEAAGRFARYRFLADRAAKLGAAAVVVGHHADDQVETVLLHLLRGSGSSGLRGMQAVGVLPGNEDVVLLRPLLTTTRAEIEAYCHRHGLKPRHDASNEDVQFTRNRIRHELLPILRTYNPQIDNNLRQLGIITTDERAVLQAAFDARWPVLQKGQGKDWLVLDRNQFLQEPIAWQRLALRRAVQVLRPFISEVGFTTVELARELVLTNKTGTEATLPGGLVMQVAPDELYFGLASAVQVGTVPQLPEGQPLPLLVPGKVMLPHGWVIQAEWERQLSVTEVQHNEDPWRAFVTLAEGDSFWIRPYLPSERFQPLGLEGRSQKVVDLLSNRKVARDERPLWPVVATTQHPAWIVGLQVDHRMRVQEKTLRFVRLTCWRDGG